MHQTHELSEELPSGMGMRQYRRAAVTLAVLSVLNLALLTWALAGRSPQPAARPAGGQDVVPALPQPADTAATGKPPVAAPVAGITSPRVSPADVQAAEQATEAPVPERFAASLVERTDALPVEETSSAPPPAEPRGLVLVNPPTAGGAVYYTVDGAVFGLEPGAYQELGTLEQRRVRFHRGEDFGEADHRLLSGTHVFQVGERGWTLSPVDGAAAAELLRTCRLVPAAR